MAEDRVLAFITDNNRPYNAQVVSDFLAQHGVKKTQVQKACESLAEAGKILCKEFGKVKIYMPKQDGLESLSKEELEQQKKRHAELSQQVVEERQAVSSLRAELQQLQSAMSLEELTAKAAQLAEQVAKQESKLSGLKAGAGKVSAADQAAVEKEYMKCMDAWARRKRMFKDIWDAVSENMDGNRRQLLEDIGIEEDEKSASYDALSKFKPSKLRRC